MEELSTEQKTEAENIKKVRDILVDIQTKAFDRGAAYNNLILLGGYAGAFTTWNFTRATMSPEALAAVGLLLTISLTTFVLFEVYKMTNNVRTNLQQRALCSENLPASQFLARMAELQKRVDSHTLKVMMPAWGVSLAITALTAIGAIGLLCYAFLATLFGWPRWP